MLWRPISKNLTCVYIYLLSNNFRINFLLYHVIVLCSKNSMHSYNITMVWQGNNYKLHEKGNWSDYVLMVNHSGWSDTKHFKACYVLCRNFAEVWDMRLDQHHLQGLSFETRWLHRLQLYRASANHKEENVFLPFYVILLFMQ